MDHLNIHFETDNAISEIEDLLKKVHNPRRLLKRVQKYINYVTRQMFTGKRADTGGGKRGIKWKKLERSTIDDKIALAKRGKLTGTKNPRRPMIRTGDLKFSHKVLRSFKRGFIYGTLQKSKKGFNYPGFHNYYDFPWLFLTQKDTIQMTSMIKDFLQNKMNVLKSYRVKEFKKLKLKKLKK
jgi:hypothetical protein